VLRQQIIGHAVEWAVILLPLIIYLLVLGFAVNRRRRPLMMSGPVNMFFLLLACSGFFLFGPPSWLVHPFRHEGAASRFLIALLPAQFGSVLSHGTHRYFIAYSVYVAVLLSVAAWLMTRQRRFTFVYNIDPVQFGEFLAAQLEEMQVRYTATPGRLALAEGQLVLDLESSYLLNNVCMHWIGREPALRDKIERRLREALAREEGGPNAASAILSLAAACLIGLVLFPTIVYFKAFFRGD